MCHSLSDLLKKKEVAEEAGAHLGIFEGRGGFQKKGTILIMKTIACKNLKNLSSVLDVKVFL